MCGCVGGGGGGAHSITPLFYNRDLKLQNGNENDNIGRWDFPHLLFMLHYWLNCVYSYCNRLKILEIHRGMCQKKIKLHVLKAIKQK